MIPAPTGLARHLNLCKSPSVRHSKDVVRWKRSIREGEVRVLPCMSSTKRHFVQVNVASSSVPGTKATSSLPYRTTRPTLVLLRLEIIVQCYST